MISHQSGEPTPGPSKEGNWGEGERTVFQAGCATQQNVPCVGMDFKEEVPSLEVFSKKKFPSLEVFSKKKFPSLEVFSKKKFPSLEGLGVGCTCHEQYRT